MRKVLFVCFIVVAVSVSVYFLITQVELNSLSEDLIVKSGSSIQKTIDAAKSGQTIIIEEGVYEEALAISKNLFIQAADGHEVTISLGSCNEPMVITDIDRQQSGHERRV